MNTSLVLNDAVGKNEAKTLRVNHFLKIDSEKLEENVMLPSTKKIVLRE